MIYSNLDDNTLAFIYIQWKYLQTLALSQILLNSFVCMFLDKFVIFINVKVFLFNYLFILGRRQML